MKKSTAAKVTALVVKHVSAPASPLVLRQFPGSHEGLSDDSLVLWKEDGDYSTGHDYWVEAAAANAALTTDLRAMGLFVEPVHAESIAVCKI